VTTGSTDDGESTLRLSSQALDLASRHAAEAVPLETGGILVGWWEDRAAVLHDFLLVPDRKAGHYQYLRSHRAAEAVLREYLDGCEDTRVGYIGEWHTHPAPQPPSTIDRAALAAIVSRSRAPAALVVLMVGNDAMVTPAALIAHPHRARFVRVRSASIERMLP